MSEVVLCDMSHVFPFQLELERAILCLSQRRRVCGKSWNTDACYQECWGILTETIQVPSIEKRLLIGVEEAINSVDTKSPR